MHDPVEKARKQADLGCIIQAANAGYVRLKFLDESGFSAWSPVSYGWFPVGKQKRQEQSLSRGKRLSILSSWEPEHEMVYALAVGSITSAIYIDFMNWQALQAHRLLQRTGRITVIVQDNASIHTSKAVQAQIPGWQEQGLYCFQLPKYCSEMNLIEGEWHQIKAHEIRGQMASGPYALAVSVVGAVNRRGEAAGYRVNRFHCQNQRLIRSPLYKFEEDIV